MSLKSRIRSKALNVLLDERVSSAKRFGSEMRRRVSGKSHEVSAFLQLDDPYSYLLSTYLPCLVEGYDIRLTVNLTQALGDEFMPMPAMLAEYAVADCRLLALELGVPFLDKGDTPVVEHRRTLLDVLAGEHGNEAFPELFAAALSAYWRGDAEGVARLVGGFVSDGRAHSVIEASNTTLRKLGHYSTATLHYGGEWYWGIDRLHYLVSRLEGLGLRVGGKPPQALLAIQQAVQLNLPATVPARAESLPPLELFYSFRSPYSYLALGRLAAIADAFGLRLDIRPVLPMVMRGLKVPRAKLLYIAADAKREAERLQIPFASFCDPVGAGAERCMAVFAYAEEEGRGTEFVRAAGNAIWNEAIDVATDKGMRRVAEQAGLFWPEAAAAMSDEGWRDKAEQNRNAMTDIGLWGVPVFKLGDLALWGQDRVWLLARQIEDLCQDGQGILE
ncbi:MAG: 2-hydroxychromene-2-carboxylate isomerase [Gammaproteobacteria bacterium]|nr:2-hydroxychromene-2-carboxylate isomerase [Gammaproteobacteria bacterium]